MVGNVVILKEQFEQLFPGKWLLPGKNQRNIETGLAEIDFGPCRGIGRKSVTEWAGRISCGKTTILRKIITNWCQAGLHVVYVDTANKLIAADWAFVEQSCVGAGRFLIVRNLFNYSGQKQNALWITEKLIRSNLFDVVVFDVTDSVLVTSRFYVRLQRSLDISKTALLLMKDQEIVHSNLANWGVQTSLNFQWSTPIVCELGLNGLAAITPGIYGSVWKDGFKTDLEVTVDSYAPNRLFTHPQIPDRRTSKTRDSFKK
jgi:hypothetical protein